MNVRNLTSITALFLVLLYFCCDKYCAGAEERPGTRVPVHKEDAPRTYCKVPSPLDLNSWLTHKRTFDKPFGKGKTPDCSDLRFFQHLNKSTYLSGEPIFVQFSARNDSSELRLPVAMALLAIPAWHEHFYLSHEFSLCEESRGEAERLGFFERFSSEKIPSRGTLDYDELWWYGMETSTGNYKDVLPKDSIVGGQIVLNPCFDVTTPGQYQLTDRLYRDYRWGKILDPPKRSNPVSFRVASGPAFSSSGLKKPGKWDHPAENPLEFAPVTNSPKRFFELPPEGDYSKLKLVLRSNKAKHGADEPVFVRIFLKNESETEAPLCLESSGFWGDARFSVTDSQGNSVPKTRLGKRRFPIENRPENGIDWIFSGPGFAPSFVKIPPGREIEIGPGEILLNLYYDISVPGKYRVQIARSTLLPGQAYENPLESNELLLDTRGPALRPEDLLEPGNFETKSLP